MFRDRDDAGQKLAAELKDPAGHETVVLALPRGGVPVAAIVAESLEAPLGLLMVRKIGAPGQPELAVAAVVDTGETEREAPKRGSEERSASLEILRNDELVHLLGVPESHMEQEVQRAGQEIAERQALYGEYAWSGSLEGRRVILIDDGVATGLTARAALQALQRRGPAQLVFAAPVAAPDVASDLAQLADRLVILHQPEDLGAVSLWYQRFKQVSDQEVTTALSAAARHRRLSKKA